MALPSNTTISISQIRTELGSGSGSLRTLSSLAGKSTPDAMSEFWGYSAGPPTIYWNGTMLFGYQSGGNYADFYVDSYRPTTQNIVTESFDAVFNLASTPTNWDRIVPDKASGATEQVSFGIYAPPGLQGYGSDRVYVELGPPSGRSFANVTWIPSNYILLYYDVSASIISLEYHAAQDTFGSFVDLYFDLI